MEIELRDWTNDLDISLSEADYLHTLDRIRLEHPIIHTMIMGTRTAISMTHKIGWPKANITWQLRQYKKEGLVYDREGLRSIEWLLTLDPEGYLHLKEWVLTQRAPGGLFNPTESRQD